MVIELRPLPPSHCQRPKPVRATWDYGDYESWRDEIWRLLDPIFDSSARDHFIQNRPEFVVSDDLSWLDGRIYEAGGGDVDSKQFLLEQLIDRFDSIRAIHGSRTDDVAKFYEQGIRPLDASEQHERAAKIFLSGEFPELSEEDLHRAISQGPEFSGSQQVWFECNERLLFEHAGHYMQYGSEYLIAIAANLGGNRDYRQVLRKHGKPTTFICDVPFAMIPTPQMLGFCGLAIARCFEELLEGKEATEWSYRHFGAAFCLHETLPAKHIVGHFIPDLGLRGILSG